MGSGARIHVVGDHIHEGALLTAVISEETHPHPFDCIPNASPDPNEA